MAQPATAVNVEDGLWSARVVWPDPAMSPVVLKGRLNWWWRNNNLDLYDGTATERISAIAGLGDVVQGLALLAKGSAGSNIIPITGASIADRMPWEALEPRFLDQSLVCHPVRADATITAVPPDRPGPLRVALLVGHEGPDKTFARDQELGMLKSAFTASAQTRARIVDAQAIATLDLAAVDSETERRAFFTQADPHVVFYFGHGRAGGSPGVRVGPKRGDWLPLDQLAGYASDVHPFPASWVFIACSIGEAPSTETGPAGPEAFRILARRGARAMLAMRARIRPRTARLVAASLIENLSAGMPLELAAAVARRTARRALDGKLVDWATPAVWSTVVGPMPPRGTAIPLELVAAKLTRRAVDDLGIGLDAPDGPDSATAERWSREQRIRVDISHEDNPSTRSRLGKIAGAIGALSGRPALFIEISGSAPFVERLAYWAKLVLAALDRAERETALGRAVDQLANQDLEGLESLLGIPKIAVILSSPPRASEATAWNVLEGAGADTTVVIGYSSVNQEQRPGWTLDRIEAEGAMQGTLEALAHYPNSLALLAVLDSPANLGSVAAITGEPRAEVAGLTIMMPSGVVLTAAARNEIRSHLTDEAIVQAHRRAFEARRSDPPLIESDNIFAAVRDLVGAHAVELIGFVNALEAQLSHNWTEADWLKLAHALEPATDQWPGLDPEILLKIAAILVARQALPQARLWLGALQSDDPDVDARRQFMLSEIAKAGGTAASRERMWKHARGSLRRLEEAIETNPGNRRFLSRRREMRANLARLELYFNHDAVTARSIFDGILKELEGEPENEVAELLVATLRNLAECLFEFEPFRSSSENRAEARRHLIRAAEIARGHKFEALWAEVLYSTAKLDEVESDPAAARDHLAETVRHARAAGHVVCQRIAEMREFWFGVRHDGERFDHALFTARLRKLEFLQSHAWARRYAAQSRLWAAHALDRSGDRAGVRALLERNIATFEPLRTLSSNADRRFVALGHAGLASIEEAAGGGAAQEQKSWTQFKALDWAPAWIEERSAADPLKYWRGDT